MARVEDRWLRRDRTRTAEYGKGLRWRAVWDEPGTGEKKKSFATKDAAKGFIATTQAEIQAGTYHSASSGLMTVGEWAEVWYTAQAHQRDGSQETIRRRMDRNILPTLGHIPLRELERGHIQNAVKVWSDTLAPSTIKTTYVYLAGMLKAAVADKHLRVTPTVGVNLPKLEKAPVRPLSVDAVQRLVDMMPRQYQEAVVFAAATGLRPSELFGVTWDRLDLDAGVVVVDRQLIRGGVDGVPVLGPLKTDYSYRSVTFGSATTLMLKSREEWAPTDLVFRSRTGGPALRNARSMVWANCRRKLPGIGEGWHQLRHHHASLLIAEGLSPVAVAHRLGHKDANETLKTYAHLWATDDDRMVAASDGLVHLPPSETP